MAIANAQKERIRGPKLSAFINYLEGVPFEKALARADAENRVIASNARLGKSLIGSDEWKRIHEVFPCWSGTVTAYSKPGQKLGRQIEYRDLDTKYWWVFPVPEEHQDRKDVILVAEHPDYSLEIYGTARAIIARSVDLVENFPGNHDYYEGDTIHDIPTGRRITQSSLRARYLMRSWITGAFVGPVARSFGEDEGLIIGGTGVIIAWRPSVNLGMAVETFEVDNEKVTIH